MIWSYERKKIKEAIVRDKRLLFFLSSSSFFSCIQSDDLLTKRASRIIILIILLLISQIRRLRRVRNSRFIFECSFSKENRMKQVCVRSFSE